MPAKQFPCRQCGAKLEYQPGTATLKCPYCNASNDIPQSHEDVAKYDFRAALENLSAAGEKHEAIVVRCDGCGSQTTLPVNVTASNCPFCGKTVVATASATTVIKPTGLLPFKLTRDEAMAQYKKWLDGLWFAPNALKRETVTDNRFTGMYVPYWTYDSDTTSFYTGERGEDYWEEEEYETTDEKGNRVTRTRRVLKTLWIPVSGVVYEQFNDILILATRSLPPHYATALEPWDLPSVVPYQDDFLSGFRAETYSVSLPDGFGAAKEIMTDRIQSSVCSDIGGDHQRIFSVSTRYDNVAFQHLLLPIWISAYRFQGKVYQFLVNARTGEVQGERPYSPWKIASAIITALLLIFIIFMAVRHNQHIRR